MPAREVAPQVFESREEAQQIFELLAADPFAPAGIRNRALELSSAAQSR